jgi:hypothetical protein
MLEKVPHVTPLGDETYWHIVRHCADCVADQRWNEVIPTMLTADPAGFPILMNEIRLDRILETVAFPAQLDKCAMARDLLLVRLGYWAHHRLPRRVANERYRALKVARRLKPLLQAGVVSYGLIVAFNRLILDLNREPATNDDVRDALTRQIIRAVLQIPPEIADKDCDMARRVDGMSALADGRVQQVSAFEALVGIGLLAIYDEYLAVVAGPATYTRDPVSGEVKGAYIDFAEAALCELNIVKASKKPYSRKSIAEALTRLRTGRLRRDPMTGR